MWQKVYICIYKVLVKLSKNNIKQHPKKWEEEINRHVLKKIYGGGTIM